MSALQAPLSLEHARALDRADALAPFRSRFHLPPGRIYLNGNSLGLLSHESEAAVQEVLHQWKTLGGAAWTAPDRPWFTLAERLSADLAGLLGAPADEVIVTGSTTVNLHQLLATFYRPEGPRRRVLIDALAFPTDAYAVQSHARLHGLDPADAIAVVPSHDGFTLDEAEIIGRLGAGDVHTAILPAVVFGSGQWLDMPRISAAAREAGVMIGWDCSHAIGAVPLDLGALASAGADFAFWCSYKYLNAGPGAVGGLWVPRRHRARRPGLAGWFGSDKQAQFRMEHEFTPAEGAGRFQLGSPHVLSMAALAGAVTLFTGAGMGRLRRKSLAMTDYLFALLDGRLAGGGFSSPTPREAHRRGGHVALRHAQAERLCRALSDAGITADFRRPDVLRLTPAPLYNTFEELWTAADTLARLAG